MKKSLKWLALALAAVMIICFAACKDKPPVDEPTTAEDGTTAVNDETDVTLTPIAIEDIKVGFIFLHDENSTYDKNFITAAEEACEKAGVKILKKTNIRSLMPERAFVRSGWG